MIDGVALYAGMALRHLAGGRGGAVVRRSRGSRRSVTSSNGRSVSDGDAVAHLEPG